MTQEERLDYLIHYLLSEDKQYQDLSVPNNETDKKRLLRSLMNVRPPKKISQDFLKIQDLYLQEELKKKKTISFRKLPIYNKKPMSLRKGIGFCQQSEARNIIS